MADKDIKKEQKDDKAKMYKDIEPAKKSPKLEQLEKLVKKDPERVAQMIKNWINEE